MELQTTTGNGSAVVTLVYTVDADVALCFDSGSGREYERTVHTATLNQVLFNGIDIIDAISDEQFSDLEMECEAEVSKQQRLANAFPSLQSAANGLMSLSIRGAA